MCLLPKKRIRTLSPFRHQIISDAQSPPPSHITTTSLEPSIQHIIKCIQFCSSPNDVTQVTDWFFRVPIAFTVNVADCFVVEKCQSLFHHNYYQLFPHNYYKMILMSVSCTRYEYDYSKSTSYNIIAT